MKQKGHASSDILIGGKLTPFRQEGCRVFSRLKYLWSKILWFRNLASFAAILNAMDPKVAKLLEGKTDQEKFQAIAFSFQCLLTRPTINSNVDAPMKGELKAKKKSHSQPKYSFEELSDDEESSE